MSFFKSLVNRNDTEYIKFANNKIFDLYSNGKKIIAFTTSLKNIKLLDSVLECVLQNFNLGVKLNIVKVNIEDFNKIKFEEKITEYKDKDEICIVMLPPVNKFACSSVAVRSCDAVVSIEKYGKSKYNDFENLLNNLSEEGIKLDGVIVCK